MKVYLEVDIENPEVTPQCLARMIEARLNSATLRMRWPFSRPKKPAIVRPVEHADVQPK